MSSVAAYLVLAAALVLVSTSGPLIVMSGMDGYAIALWRMALAAAAFWAWARARGATGQPGRHVRQLVAGGACLTAHFLLWIVAFDYTDYASNLILLVSQPVFGVVLGARIGERTTPRTWLALAMAVAGMLVITGADVSLGARALVGDAMCLAGTFFIALFYYVTRDARAALPVPMFMACTMGVGAVLALPVCLAVGANLVGYPPTAAGWIAAMVVLPTLGGHGLMNLAARHLPLFTINMAILMEPVLSILFGAVLFGAAVTFGQTVGGAILGVAVTLALWRPAPR